MLHQLSERDADRLLSGEQPLHRPDLVEMAQLVATLRASTETEAPPMRPQLLAELDVAEAAGASAGRDPAAALAAAFGDELGRRRKAARRNGTRPDGTSGDDTGRDDAQSDEAQHLAGSARRRWRLIGAAAMVAMLGGIVAAHAHGAFLPSDDEPTHTSDLDPADRDGPEDRTADEVPPTTAPAVTTTVPQPATPPEQPTTPSGQVTEDQGRSDRDGDRDGRRRRWDPDMRRGDDGEVFIPGRGWVDVDELCGRDGRDCWSGDFDQLLEWYESGGYGP